MTTLRVILMIQWLHNIFGCAPMGSFGYSNGGYLVACFVKDLRSDLVKGAISFTYCTAFMGWARFKCC